MMESVTERTFLFPGNLNEKVVATKVSGFKNPSFSTTATDFQPFSFYEDYFKVLGKDFLNPVTSGSTNKYYFNIEDTLFQKTDTVYIISFRPLKETNFDGLKGLLYINTNQYAIQNVIASPYDEQLIDMKIQQQYTFVNNKQWFPDQLNYEVYFKNYPTKNLGMRLTGKSYISNVVFDTALLKKDFDYQTLVMVPDAADKNDAYWQLHRKDPLDNKEKKTYRVIDSIGKAQHLDRTLKIIESLFTFQIPISIISIDLNKIIGLNDYEQLRLGMGLHTNDKLSKWFSMGGYIGYGIKDSIIKYGGDIKLNFKPGHKDFYFKYAYSKDLAEPAKTQYFYSRNNYNRNLITYRMDYIEQHEVSLNFRAFKYLVTNIDVNKSIRMPYYDYLFLPNEKDNTLVSTKFNSAELRIKARYAYKEKLVQSFGQLLSDGTKYPVIYAGYTKGFKVNTYGDYDYQKISLGIQKSFLIKNIGRTNLLVEGGYLQGIVPFSYLFNGNGSNATQQYIYVDNTFQTMGLYEFLSDQYANIFFSHDFGSLLFKRPKFQPRFVIFSNAGYGSLRNPEQHANIPFKTMEKGFYESGLVINNILRYKYYNTIYIGIGGGAFARYGAYAYPDMKDNMAYRVSLTLSF